MEQRVKRFAWNLVPALGLAFLSGFRFNFSPETKEDIRRKQEVNYMLICDICGQPIINVDDTSFHHKTPKSDTEHCTSNADNGAALHVSCHSAVENYARQGIPYDLIKEILGGGAI